ncbi:NF-X1-type zinc finger protein NFXL1 [Anopheles moucheti]|uniref:NF-X1-type zinc finger protein NFXL1 n=1 Tax=Anopheles moucheti TaxID=186751 RepID=UPI0022F0AC93|nr:NF-X1-type zinc finger protein NFXL1 [Anopheles moucheti]
MASRNRSKILPKEQNAWNVPVQPKSEPVGGKPRKSSTGSTTSKATSPSAVEQSVSGSKIPLPTVSSSMLKKSQDKFIQVQRQHAETAMKYAAEYVSSDDDEEEDLGQDENNGEGSDVATRNILGDVLKNYHGIDADVGKTQEYLQNLLESRNAVCLICIETVKRADRIWSCNACYTFFHLMCIQRWANDSMSMKRMNHEQQEGYYNNRGEYIPKPALNVQWDCPKCRREYVPEEIPRHYECFCGKERDPSAHPWLIPHSCGEPCEKNLTPACGHTCRLLCHPGPCPPCPQTINVSCRCGCSPVKTIRCAQKTWTCTKKCKRTLSCGIHECGTQCHDRDNCPACQNRSEQPCLCGSQTKEVNCHESRWQCGTVCSKPLACGLHRCERVCHAGLCGVCPLGLPRSCPCGKSETRVASCAEHIGTCGDTCEKLLACEQHRCPERCHQGPCGKCLELVPKVCRCGSTKKAIVCHREAICEGRCKRMRTCGKHQCNRKCCDGQCQLCDRVCGKTLPCGKHKCSSLCHQGPCYPCNQKSSVKCRCGGTVVEVACGRERKANAPKCKLPCRVASKCHHPNTHSCHIGECPTCTQPCGERNDTTNCEHPCGAKCHDAVRVVTRDKNFKPVGPWDVPKEIVEVKTLPHPACTEKVPVMCLGGHETIDWPCSISKPSSCGRPCDRLLKCGIHRCPLTCHKVTHRASTTQDSRCEACSAGCSLSRPRGCIHQCILPCHKAPCNPCLVSIKANCYCGLTQVFYKCHEFYPAGVENKGPEEMAELDRRRESFLSCGQKCIKNFPCGHRCFSICHPGRCPNPELCSKKVKISCKCAHRKAEVSCKVARNNPTLDCDQQCEAIKAQKQEEQDRKERETRAQQELENQRELEEYERKFNKRKYRERKRHQVQQEETGRHWAVYVLPIVAVLVGVVAYVLFME